MTTDELGVRNAPAPAGEHPVADVRSTFGSLVDAAVRSEAFTAVYQPILDLRTMEVVGLEALARWPDAPPGLERPDAFLEVVASIGSMARFTDWMLRRACSEVASGVPAERGWWVSVNLGAPDCADPALGARVRSALAAAGLPGDRLVAEVSEQTVPHQEVVDGLRGVADLGVRVALDDFGSGPSTLSQLRSLPLDLVKIDRSLVSGSTLADRQLCLATVAMADALGLQTLAEGVRSGEQLLWLCVAGCDFGQGSWWSMGEPLEAIIERFGRPAAPVPEA